MVILGINAYHGDSSACLVIDGRLVAAAEEERFRRVKHWAGFPARAIAWCFESARLRISDVDHVAINQDRRANLWRKVAYTLSHRPDPRLVVDRLRRKSRRAGVDEELAGCFPGEPFRAEMHAIEHHLAHLASAYLVSPFAEAVTVSVDGFGDFASAGWGLGRHGRIEVEDRVYFPHSLGIFYEAITRHLGFPKYGDEYKVMGLAPYGRPSFLPQMARLVRLHPHGRFELGLEYFRHHREKVSYEWENGEPVMGNVAAAELQELLGPARAPEAEITERHRDIARSAQAMYEEAFFHLLRHLADRYRVDSLALAGGCAMNSVANGRIHANTPFRRLYVQSAPGDAGGAIGAAFVAWQRADPRPAASGERFAMRHAYWGPEFDAACIHRLLDERRDELARHGCRCSFAEDEAHLCRMTAASLAAGEVIGWFQGRMEWGPRALGNRSIVCDPRRPDMKDILNRKIKRRESFRPFAPSILREAVGEWFEVDEDVPFMTQVYPIREAKRAVVPAVTHVDGSGRLQTVDRDANPLYHRLISSFGELTGIPMVLNTSFNENEPVVCRPEEALDCFLRTNMDLLVLGDCMIRREA